MAKTPIEMMLDGVEWGNVYGAMKKVSPLLGRKRTEGQKQRAREGIARRQAKGLPFGSLPDPRTRIETRICKLPSCGREFQFRIRPKTEPSRGRYCTQKHAVQHVAILRCKVPADYELLFDLYVTKNMTTVEIGKMFGTNHGAVRHRLRDVGIMRRKVGISRHKICTVEGCNEPCFKLRHPLNGSLYGTLCKEHRRLHRNKIAREYVASDPARRQKRIDYSREYYKRTRDARIAYSREHHRRQSK